MENNEEARLAWQFITETNVSVFMTGRAGTGKTTFLRNLFHEHPKRMVIVAPTGVAAINAGGQTIHSFFQLPLGVNIPGVQRQEKGNYFRMSKQKKNIIRTLDLLIIDEISMVRADLLDAIDDTLRKYREPSKPFGGVQLLMIGDLQQLSPVAKDDEWEQLKAYYQTPYFFSSRALQQIQYITIELKHIYRQTQTDFIELLGAIRKGRVDEHVVQMIGARYIPNFKTPGHEHWIRLTTHNRMADDYNRHKLESILTPSHTYTAKIEGNFPELSYPCDFQTELKVGAQVMFLKNDPSPQHLFYNGKIGRVTTMSDERVLVQCPDEAEPIEVKPMTWENMKYTLDATTGVIKEEVDGTFTQMPLRLAWAITIHKSQGLTFDHAVLDINDSFAHGQVYVALSRCRTLEGLVLARPLQLQSIITDQLVEQYLENTMQQSAGAKDHLPEMRRQYFLMLVTELFSFQKIIRDAEYVQRITVEHLAHQQPEYLQLLNQLMPQMREQVQDVAMRFQQQYTGIIASDVDYTGNQLLQVRVKNGAQYFLEKLNELLVPIINGSHFEIGNKTTEKQFKGAIETLTEEARAKVFVLRFCATAGFETTTYLQCEAKAILQDEIQKATKTKTKTKTMVRQTHQPESTSDKPKRKLPAWMWRKIYSKRK